NLHPHIFQGRTGVEVSEGGGLKPVIVIVRVGDVDLDTVIELAVDVAIQVQASPADKGCGRVVHPIHAAAGDGERTVGADQPGRVDLGIATHVNMELVISRAKVQTIVPTRLELELLLVGSGRRGLRPFALGSLSCERRPCRTKSAENTSSPRL